MREIELNTCPPSSDSSVPAQRDPTFDEPQDQMVDVLLQHADPMKDEDADYDEVGCCLLSEFCLQSCTCRCMCARTLSLVTW